MKPNFKWYQGLKRFTFFYPLKTHLRVHTTLTTLKKTRINVKTVISIFFKYQVREDMREFVLLKICRKFYSQNGRLTAHMRTNFGEKPYQCKICDK